MLIEMTNREIRNPQSAMSPLRVSVSPWFVFVSSASTLRRYPIVLPSASLTSVIRHGIRLSGRGPLAVLLDLAQKAGNLLRTTMQPYHLTTGCANPAPCTCTWPSGLNATYTVTGWSGLSACSGCDASTDPAWTGALNHIGSGCIWWAADTSFDPLSINGSMLDITYTQVLLRTTTPCRWELYIACTSVVNPTKTMWSGYKTGGSTPAGTYALVASDCGNTTPTMTVS